MLCQRRKVFRCNVVASLSRAELNYNYTINRLLIPPLTAEREHPLLQSCERGMVAKCTKPELKTSFGLKCRSPKATEKKAAKRENRASMCDFGPEASPKDGVVGDGGYIASEHESHA